MSHLEEYKALLDEYYVIIHKDGWVEKLDKLMPKMEKLWTRMNRDQKDECWNHCQEIHRKRINQGGTNAS